MIELKKISIIYNRNNKQIIVSIAFIIVIIAFFLIYRKKRFKVSADNESKIKQLHPKLRYKARKFISNAKRKGYDLRITESLRTFERQIQLFAQGRTTSGQKVTNANAGSSYHNYGLAIDVVDRNNGYSTNWQEIGKIGKKAGFEWGGDWSKFKDNPHFQLTLGKKTAELKKLYQAGNWKNYPNTTTLKGLNGNINDKLSNFIDKSLKNKQYKGRLLLTYVNGPLSRKIKKVTGKDLKGYEVFLYAEYIRHIYNSHPNTRKNDFKLIIDNFTKPDIVLKGYDKQGMERIKLIKQYDNKQVIISEINILSDYLKVITMFTE